MNTGVLGALKRAGHGIFLFMLVGTALRSQAVSSVTLAWDASTDPTVVGYNIYYGTASRTYTNLVNVTMTNAVTISGLVPAVTYYFAATAYTGSGLESEFSTEAFYAVPALNSNQPPTLDPIADLTVNEDPGPRTVTLSGISSGASNEVQTLSVSASSSLPSLIPDPVVNYASPNRTGSLSFTPAPDAFGSATITVVVNDGQAVNNTLVRSFAVNVLPINDPPTLNPLADLVIDENSGSQTVALSGISAGSVFENQPLTVTASSSNPGLVQNLAVAYGSPATSGTLSFSPATDAYGSATITVTVNDGQPTNNLLARSFNLTVNQTTSQPAPLTNAIIVPGGYFSFVLNPPYTNGDKFSFSLDSSAPAGATITTRRGVSTLIWVPSNAQASTTNLINIVVTDKSHQALNTNETVLVIVLDYCSIAAGSTSVRAGMNAALPLYLNSSDGLTNLAFTIDWPTAGFVNPYLSSPMTGLGSILLQDQGTNLLLTVQPLAGQVISGSNRLAQLNFQTISNQPSAFISLPIQVQTASRPNGQNYSYYITQPGRVTVVNDVPLLEADLTTNANRFLTVYARTGIVYQVQYSTNQTGWFGWYPLLNYTQTNLAQAVSVDSPNSVIFYRLFKP